MVIASGTNYVTCGNNGQNAPGPGIMLRNYGIEVRTHDVVLRYLRVRVGDDAVHLDDPRVREAYYGGAGEHALYFIEGAKNCIADHLSLSWSTTKILTVNKMSDLITVQWCILSEGLNFADHGLCTIIGQARQTWHHNLLAHNQGRNPRFGDNYGEGAVLPDPFIIKNCGSAAVHELDGRVAGLALGAQRTPAVVDDGETLSAAGRARTCEVRCRRQVRRRGCRRCSYR